MLCYVNHLDFSSESAYNNIVITIISNSKDKNRHFFLIVAGDEYVYSRTDLRGRNMSSTLVIYSSKYGSTKQYAQWIADELRGDLKEVSEVKSYELTYYDTVVFGAPLYAGKLYHYQKVLEVLTCYPPKKFLIFAVGLNALSEDYIHEIKETNKIDEDKVFYFQGKLDYQHLTLLDKFLMQGLKKYLKKKSSLTDSDQQILKSFEHPIDAMKFESIQPLIDYVHENTLK